MTDLPTPLLQTASGAVVEVSREAGGFYCEHCLFAVRRAVHDSVVVGFLHVPPDRFPSTTSQARRHCDTRAVVASALRGFLDLDATSSRTTTRVLLTGFRPWGAVQRNPSGDFVGHGGNVDAVIARLGGRTTGRVDGRRAAVVAGRHLEIAGAVLPVDDRGIDGGPLSVQAVIARHRPDFVLSMGVHRESARYRVELRTTNRRLRVDGGLAHDEGITTATVALPDDDALARLLVSGWRSSISMSTASPPSGTGLAPAS